MVKKGGVVVDYGTCIGTSNAFVICARRIYDLFHIFD